MFNTDVANEQRQKPHTRFDVLDIGEICRVKTVRTGKTDILQRKPGPREQLRINPASYYQRAASLVKHELLNAIFMLGKFGRADHKRGCHEQGRYHSNQS